MSTATTIGIIKKAKFTWIIRDVLNWPVNAGDSLNSPPFHAFKDEGIKWALVIKQDPWNDGALAMFLHLSESPSSEPSVKARFSIVVSDENRGQLLYEKKTNVIPMTIYQLSGRVDHHLFNGRFPMGHTDEFLAIPPISFKIDITVEYQLRNAFSSVYYLPNQDNQKSSLTEDYKNLFTSKSGSDISFIIDGQEIRAHKTVLAARSPVYAAMFNSDMKEKRLQRFNVHDDISPDVFNEFLRFVYTDQVNLKENNAEPLLVAADKYLLPSLKSKCEEFLINHLTTENCIELLTLANIYSALDLKKMTQALINSHYTTIRETAAWKALKISHPDIALDAFERLVD